MDDLTALSTPENYATPAQLENARAYARLLLKDSTEPVKHWTGALGGMAEALVGGLGLHKAGRDENAMWNNWAQRLPQDPSKTAAPARAAYAAAMPYNPDSGEQSQGPMSFTVPEGGPPRDALSAIDAALKIGGKGERPQAADVSGKDPSMGIPIDQREATFNERFPKYSVDKASGGSALRFSGEPVNVNSRADAPPAITMALAKGAAKGSVPGAPPSGPDALGNPTYIDPATLPKRPKLDRPNFEALMANQFMPPEYRKAMFEAYYGQGQPQTVDYLGGQVVIDPNSGRQQYKPAVHWNPSEAGDVKTQRPQIVNPDGTTRTLPPEGGGGMAPKPTAPGTGAPALPGVPSLNDAGALQFAPDDQGTGGMPPGMLGAGPPTQPRGAEATGGLTGNVKTAQLIDPEMQAAADWSQKRKLDFEAQKEYNNKDIDSFQKKYDLAQEGGKRAAMGMPQLELAKQLIEDPNFYSGIGANLVIDWKRIKAAVGSDPKAAAANETFDKIISGNIVEDMKIMLQGLGQVRVAEIDLLSKAAANRYNSPAANRAVLDLMIRAHKQVDMLSNVGNAYRQGVRWDKDGNPQQTNERPTTAGYDATIKKFVEKFPVLTAEQRAKYDQLFRKEGFDEKKAAKIKQELEDAANGKTQAAAPAGARPAIPTPPAGFGR